MKFGAIVIVALIISAIAAHFLLGDPGYVAINFRGYLIEMSLTSSPSAAGCRMRALRVEAYLLRWMTADG